MSETKKETLSPFLCYFFLMLHYFFTLFHPYQVLSANLIVRT